jgi:phosphoglycerate dehydrogenase-like enzyme
VNAGNPLLAEQRIVVTPHVAGSTDAMLKGTVKYLGEVLAGYVKGIRPEGVVNELKEPRVPLRIRIRNFARGPVCVAHIFHTLRGQL